jgi:hypothetical protein
VTTPQNGNGGDEADPKQSFTQQVKEKIKINKIQSAKRRETSNPSNPTSREQSDQQQSIPLLLIKQEEEKVRSETSIYLDENSKQRANRNN